MKAGIHPVYKLQTLHCSSCGNEWQTRTTQEANTNDGKVHLEICSNCHPFFTGKQKLMDKAGRVERFRRRYAANAPKADAPGADAPAAETPKAPETAGQ
jgi:large subunit ribosomal protein L31